MFDNSLQKHRLNFGPLVFAIAFVTIGISALVDASFNESVAWLWGAALVVLGMAGLATVIDRQRPASSTAEDNSSADSEVHLAD